MWIGDLEVVADGAAISPPVPPNHLSGILRWNLAMMTLRSFFPNSVILLGPVVTVGEYRSRRYSTPLC